MRPKAKGSTKELSHVRFPAEYLKCVDDLLHALHERVLEHAASLALSKCRRGEVCVVDKEDLSESLRSISRLVVNEVERQLATLEHGYVRSA